MSTIEQQLEELAHLAGLVHRLVLDEAQRQMVLLSLAKISITRPGWAYAIGQIVDKLAGGDLYQAFQAMGPDPLPPIVDDGRDAVAQVSDPRMHYWWEIHGEHCRIALKTRPAYCDRGNYLAIIDTWGPLELDEKDLWPRMYFDFHCAQREAETWLRKRGQWTPTSAWKQFTSDQGPTDTVSPAPSS